MDLYGLVEEGGEGEETENDNNIATIKRLPGVGSQGNVPKR